MVPLGPPVPGRSSGQPVPVTVPPGARHNPDMVPPGPPVRSRHGAVRDRRGTVRSHGGPVPAAVTRCPTQSRHGTTRSPGAIPTCTGPGPVRYRPVGWYTGTGHSTNRAPARSRPGARRVSLGSRRGPGPDRRSAASKFLNVRTDN